MNIDHEGDCHASPEDGCEACQAIYNAPQKQETAPRKPDYSFKRKGCYADYPAGPNLI